MIPHNLFRSYIKQSKQTIQQKKSEKTKTQITWNYVFVLHILNHKTSTFVKCLIDHLFSEELQKD